MRTMTQRTKPPIGDPQGRQGSKTGQQRHAKQGSGQQKQEGNPGQAKDAGQRRK
jgi:hypothetical protein